MSDIHLNNVSWREGSIRRYESMASIGAKYCFLNRVKPHRFGELLKEYLPVPDGSSYECTVDVPGFRLAQFAHLLGEPANLLLYQSAERLSLGRTLSKFVGYESLSFNHLYICPQCLAAGYHSVLHQLPWLKRCFIHDVPITPSDEKGQNLQKDLPRDTRFVYALNKIWFGGTSVWPEATRRNWVFPHHAGEHEKVKAMASVFRKIDAELERRFEGGEPVPVIVAQRGSSGLLALVRFVGCKKSQWAHYLMEPPFGVEHRILIPCTQKEANIVLGQSGSNLWSDFQYARRLECEITGERPRWRIVLDEQIDRMMMNHGECKARLTTIAEKCYEYCMTWSPWRNGTRYPAMDLLRAGTVVCKRLISVDKLQAATSIDKMERVQNFV